MAGVDTFLPRTIGERSVFFALSVMAGCCEEVVYRGFVIAYLIPWFGWWGAALGSAALFGLAHAYQGAAGLVRTAALGLVMAAAYWSSGSLWPAVLVHAAIDLHGGAIGYELFRRGDSPRQAIAL
jgi:membrane protease YdiL (CAAX protease family)